MSATKRRILGFLIDAKQRGKKVVGYGSAYEIFVSTLAFEVSAGFLPLFFAGVVLWQYSPWLILFLVAASNFFGAVFSRLGSANWIAESLAGLQFSPTAMLVLMLAIIFVLGWPLEWVPIVLIVVPIFLPLARSLGIDLVWFCTLVAVCLQTAWLSPPVALSAYFLKGVVPDWTLKDIYLGMLQFMALQVAGLGLLLAFPQLALWLPTLLNAQ